MKFTPTPTPLLRLARRDLLLPTALSTQPEGIKAWLAQLEYKFEDSDRDKAVLRAFTPERLRLAYAAECNRFSMAALETASGVIRDTRFPKSHAWRMIQTYYSAYFSAHAFLRLYARSCTNVDEPCRRAVEPLASMYSRQLDAGFYSTIVNFNYQTVTLVKLKNSHEDMWQTYLALIYELREEIPNTPTSQSEQKIAVTILNELIDGLTNGGRKNQGNWLSLIRNSVNYRFEHKVWFPYGHKIPDSLNIDQLTDRAALGVDASISTQSDLLRFYSCCLAVIKLTTNLVLTCIAECSQLNPIFKKGFCRAAAIYENA